MFVRVDDLTGYVTFTFAPSHQEEAKKVLDFAIKLYENEGYDTQEIECVQILLNSTELNIQ